MSIQQQFDAASVITKLSSAETIKLLCLAYDQDNIFAFSRLVDNTCFSKMSESQMTKLNKMLYEMACHNDLEFAKQLLKIPGIDINFQCEITRFTALVSAISNNFGKFVDLLLANPNLDVSKIGSSRILVGDFGDFRASAGQR